MSHSNSSHWLRGLCAGFNVALILAALALIFTPALTELLAYDRQAILSGELWRLWTGHLVHYGLRHALTDVGVLCLVIALSWRETNMVFTAFALWLGMPLISLGLLLSVPSLYEYRGASGIDILLAVALGVRIWRLETDSSLSWRSGIKPGLLLLAVLVILKTLLEAIGISSGISGLPPGIRVVWEAHLIGIVLGSGIGWFWSRQ